MMMMMMMMISETVRLRDTSRKPYPIYRMERLSLTLSDLCPGFRDRDIFEVEYLRNKVI